MHTLTSALAAAVAVVAFAGQPAQAIMADAQLHAPSAVQTIACRVIRERIVRPFGPPVFKEREECGEPFAMVVDDETCVVRRERIERPDGSIVTRRVRRCR